MLPGFWPEKGSQRMAGFHVFLYKVSKGAAPPYTTELCITAAAARVDCVPCSCYMAYTYPAKLYTGWLRLQGLFITVLPTCVTVLHPAPAFIGVSATCSSGAARREAPGSVLARLQTPSDWHHSNTLCGAPQLLDGWRSHGDMAFEGGACAVRSLACGMESLAPPSQSSMSRALWFPKGLHIRPRVVTQAVIVCAVSQLMYEWRHDFAFQRGACGTERLARLQLASCRLYMLPHYV